MHWVNRLNCHWVLVFRNQVGWLQSYRFRLLVWRQSFRCLLHVFLDVWLRHLLRFRLYFRLLFRLHLYCRRLAWQWKPGTSKITLTSLRWFRGLNWRVWRRCRLCRFGQSAKVEQQICFTLRIIKIGSWSVSVRNIVQITVGGGCPLWKLLTKVSVQSW